MRAAQFLPIALKQTYMTLCTLVTIFLLLVAIMQNMAFYGRWNPWHVDADEKAAWQKKALRAHNRQVPFTSAMPIGFWFRDSKGQELGWKDLEKRAPEHYNQTVVSSFAAKAKLPGHKKEYKVITEAPHALKKTDRKMGKSIRKQMKKRFAALPLNFRNWLQWARKATCLSLGLPAVTPDACKGDDYNPADDVEPRSDSVSSKDFSCVDVGEQVKRIDESAKGCGTWHLFKVGDLASNVDFVDSLPKRYSAAHLHLPKDVDGAKFSALIANVVEGADYGLEAGESGKLTVMVW